MKRDFFFEGNCSVCFISANVFFQKLLARAATFLIPNASRCAHECNKKKKVRVFFECGLPPKWDWRSWLRALRDWKSQVWMFFFSLFALWIIFLRGEIMADNKTLFLFFFNHPVCQLRYLSSSLPLPSNSPNVHVCQWLPMSLSSLLMCFIDIYYFKFTFFFFIFLFCLYFELSPHSDILSITKAVLSCKSWITPSFLTTFQKWLCFI